MSEKLRCRLKWHNWKKWTTVAVTPQGNVADGWSAGQLRQCADCWLMQTVRMGGGDFAVSLRPLRYVVRDHIADLRRCVKAIQESEYADQLESTCAEIETAIHELSNALMADEGIPVKEPKAKAA